MLYIYMYVYVCIYVFMFILQFLYSRGKQMEIAQQMQHQVQVFMTVREK